MNLLIKFSLGLILSCLCNFGYSQFIELKPNWKKGDQLTMHFTKEKGAPGDTLLFLEDSTSITYTIIDALAGGYIIKLDFSNYGQKSKRKSEFFLSDFIKECRKIPLLIKTDPEGSFRGFVDTSLIRKEINKLINDYVKTYKGTDSEIDFNTLAGMFDDEFDMYRLLVKNYLVFTLAYRSKMEVGTSLSFNTNIENPTGGRPIPANGVAELSEDRVNQDHYYFNLQIEPDPNSAKGVLSEIAKGSISDNTQKIDENFVNIKVSQMFYLYPVEFKILITSRTYTQIIGNSAKTEEITLKLIQ